MDSAKKPRNPRLIAVNLMAMGVVGVQNKLSANNLTVGRVYNPDGGLDVNRV